MLLDAIALGILAAFACLGALRGALAAGLSLVSLVLAYAGAVLAAQRFAGPVGRSLGLSELLAVPAAGTLGFLVAFLLCAVVGAGLRLWERRRRGERPRSGRDRALGGLFGVVRGGLVVLLLGWLAIWLDAARELGVLEDAAAVPETRSSKVAAATEKVVESAVEAAMADAGSGGRVAARMAARPAASLQSVQALLEDERVRRVQEDRLFWTYLEHGAVDSALNRASFYGIVHDDALRRELAELGVIGEEAAADPRVFREAAAEVIAEVGPRLRGLADDPEVQRLAEDPEVVALLESGDTFALIRHEGVQRLVARISRGL